LRTVDPATSDGNNNTFTANNANLSLSNATLNITNLMEWDGASAVSIGAGSTLNLAGSGSHLITDGVVTSAGGVVEASGSGTQTLGFAISGDGSVEQNGTGTTTLSVANSHTGGTTISAGTLVLDNASALGTGTVTLSGGLLKDNVASNATYNNDIVVTDSTSTTIIDSAGGNSYFGGAVTGTGTLNFGGSGDGQVSGTIRWQTDMSGFTGTVNYDTKNNLNNFWLEPSTGGGAGQITTAKFNLTGDTSANRSMRVRGNWEIGELSGTGGYITAWNSTLTVNQSTETTFSGVMDDAGTRILTFTKDGVGTLTMDNTHTYTGATTVSGGSGGTLEIGGAGQLGGGDYSGAVSIADGATFLFSSSASGTGARYRGDISGAGTFIKDGSNSELRFFGDNTIANVEVKQGTLRVQGTVNSLGQGGTTLRLGDTTGADDATIWYVTDIGTYATKAGIVVEAGSSGTKTIQNSGVNGDNTAITLNDNLTINDVSTFALGGVISGAGGLTKIGAGTTTLSGVNTYTGDTTVSQGTLQIGGAGRLGGGLYDGALTIDSGATFQFSSSASGTGARYRGDISGDGTFIKDGSNNELRFIGNTSVANIEIKQGTLRVQNNVNALGQGGTTVYLGDTTGANDATLYYVSNVSPFTAKAGIVVQAGSTGTKTIRTGNSAGSDDTAITLNDNLSINTDTEFTFGGAIGGSGGMTKIGNSTLTLSGDNTYSGNTTVSAGTLALSHASLNNIIGNSTIINVANSATLDVTALGGGTGGLELAAGQTISGSGAVVGDMTIGSGSVLSPGNSPGTLSHTGDQTWTDGGTYLWEINDRLGSMGVDPGWDWISIDGTLDLSLLTVDGFTIDIDSLSGASPGDALNFVELNHVPEIDYSFIIASATDGISGFDAGDFTLDDSGFNNAGWLWSIRADTNNIYLDVNFVPEPSSTALLGLGGLMLALRRRRA
jgi:autotransporter-associated beta strand protein